MRRWVSVFERLPLFSTRELRSEHRVLRARPRPHQPAQHLVVLAVGASLGASAARRSPSCRELRARRAGHRSSRIEVVATPSTAPVPPPDAAGPPAAARQPGPHPALDRPARRRAGGDAVARRSLRRSCSPDFLSEVVLYAVSVADLTLMVALVFVLARNVLKLVVERRRALPFARFRAKLVAVLLGMTLIPAVLVLHRRQRADSQQREPLVQPADRRRCSARRARSPATTTPSGQQAVSAHAADLARALAAVDLAPGNVAAIRARGRRRARAAPA